MNIINSVFTDSEAYDLYCHIYKWLTAYTPGEMGYIPRYRRYQKEAWDIVFQKLNECKDKKTLKSFKKFSIYSGVIYRVHNYYGTRKRKGYIKEISNYCVSWSKSIEGIKNVSVHGKCLLIEGKTSEGIDTFGLLEYLLRHNKHFIPRDKPAEALLRYEDEAEILYPIRFEDINKVTIINKDKLAENSAVIEEIPQERWSKKRMGY